MRVLATGLLTFSLVACGGTAGSSTDDNNANSQDSNSPSLADTTPPEITSAETINLTENQIITYQITATDNIAIQSDSYTLSGTDADAFTIDSSGGLITSKTEGDFETQSSYSIIIGVSDSSNNQSSLSISINLIDIEDEESPKITSSNNMTLDENKFINYQILANDDVALEPGSYSISGADAGYFTIDSATGLITSKARGDFETKASYTLIISVSDTSNNITHQTISISLNNLDDTAPSIISENQISVTENQTIIYKAIANDDIAIQPDSFTLSGVDAGFFTINSSTGLITSKASSDFETKSSYKITVSVSDTSGNSASMAIAITIKNEDESAPVISSVNTLRLDENQAISYQIIAIDDIALEPNSYTLSGPDANYFSINSTTGLVTSDKDGDYENKSNYLITVGVKDTSGKSAHLNITISLNNLDDTKPTISSPARIKVDENTEITYQTNAQDNIALKFDSYALSGIDADYFNINTKTGLISSKTKGDYELKSIYRFIVSVSDTSDNITSLSVTIELNDLDDIKPLITSPAELILNENQIIRYEIKAEDNVAIKSGSYAVTGDDAHLFSIDSYTGVITSLTKGDYEAKPNYSFIISVSDTSDNSTDQPVTIILNDLDDIAPQITSVAQISLDENQQINYRIIASDNVAIEPGSFTLNGKDAGEFTIDKYTGWITSLADGDYETKPDYKITVGVSDTSGNESSREITINLIDLDDSAPSITSPNNLTFEENLTINYQITATDNIGIKPGSYSISGTDSDYFTLNTTTGVVTSKVNGDYESKSSYNIIVGASDTSDNKGALNVIITLIDIDENACNYKTWNANEYCNENGISKLVVDRELLIDMIEAGSDVTNVYTGQITDMSYLFENDSTFNQNIGDWNTSNTMNMNSMFRNAYSFNQNISRWNTEKVTNMQYMFSFARNFNMDINNWNTSLVTDMSHMFEYAIKFNQPIGHWDTSRVTDMSSMFQDHQSFNQDITGWDTSNVTDMSRMFWNADRFSQDIGVWDTSRVTDMSYMFAKTSFDQNISFWDTSKVQSMERMFSENSRFNQNIGGWNTSNVQNMSHMFSQARAFNQYIGDWDTGHVADMAGMFYVAGIFNKSLNNWNTSSVRYMQEMFRGAWEFNQPIGTWDTSRVEDMSNMFTFARSFNQPIGNWDVSSVNNMSYMFHDAESFNQPIGQWRTHNVNTMEGMFESANVFNQPIGQWDVSGVKSMANMFQFAREFNQPLSQWSTLSLESTRTMFNSATAFNQDISNWVSDSIKDHLAMFAGTNRINFKYVPSYCNPYDRPTCW